MRRANRVANAKATVASAAAGSSHEICPPISELNNRPIPVLPLKFAPLPPPSEPVIRPMPLYPNARSSALLFVEPPM